MNIFQSIFTGLIVLTCLSCSKGSDDSRPNILIILADDAGYADFGFMGCKDLETPNLDALANDGIVFTDAHVSATVCAPSRAGLLTGRYQQSFGFECNGTPEDIGMSYYETFMSDDLKRAGYNTYALGKWHIGDSAHHYPDQRGFDEFYGFLAGARGYFPNEKEDNEGNSHAILHNRARVDFNGYLTDVFGDKAVDYIRRSEDNPFFMYLSFNAVHGPMHAKESHLDKYKDHPRQKLAAMTWSLDENVGKVIDVLKEKGLYENTLIYFLSDNGGAEYNQSSNLPLKGWKGNKFEGGHRVPFTVTWKKKLKGGSSYNKLTSAFDIFATSIDAAGIKHEGSALDGVSLLPFLGGENEGAPHKELYWRKDKMAGMRDGAFKLVRLDAYGYRMYNLTEDLGETKDLQNSNRVQFDSMKKALAKWEAGLMPLLWDEGKTWNAVTYEIHQGLMENRIPNYVDPGSMNRFFKSQEKNK